MIIIPRKTLFFCVLLYALISINIPVVIAEVKTDTSTAENDWLHQRMNLDCRGRSLQNVLEDVAIFFQTEIVYEAENAGRAVHCRYVKATAEQILNRIFSSENRAILIENTPKKKITVQVFGVSEYNIISNDGGSATQNIPFLADMTNELLFAMQKEQYQRYKDELKNPASIIPEVGLSRADITKLHQKQIQQNKENLQDPSLNVVGTPITQQQLRVIHEEQLIQFGQRKQDQDRIDPFTGLTAVELSELHRYQIQQ